MSLPLLDRSRGIVSVVGEGEGGDVGEERCRFERVEIDNLLVHGRSCLGSAGRASKAR